MTFQLNTQLTVTEISENEATNPFKQLYTVEVFHVIQTNRILTTDALYGR